MDSRAHRFLVLSLVVVVSSSLFAEEIPNWTVPPYRPSSASGGLSTMTDISPGVAFVAMSPCRVFDTRNANGPYGGPRLLANATRNFDIDSGPCTGIPAGVDAYSMNFGAILPDGIGFVTIWPTDVPQPTVSSINTVPGYVLANAAIVPAGTNGSISVFPNTGMHLYGDINGYFTDQYNANVSFHAVSSFDTTAAIIGDNTSGLAFAIGVLGRIPTTTTGNGSAGVRGINSGTGAAGVGVWGSHAASGWGVFGDAVDGVGVRGMDTATGASGVGVWGSHAGSGWGVYGEAVGGVGVYGKATAATGANYGMRAETASQAQNSAGIRASNGGGPLPLSILTSGARGEAGVGGIGVLGLSKGFAGASGYHVNVAGTDIEAGADLGYTSAVGLNVTGTTQATGMKNFVEPHPTDPSRVIRYASLEGNEVGTYFRGRGKFQNGLAIIEVPEDFRIVTDPQGLSIQVTPIGDMATVAVQSIDLDRVVVRGSRNVDFFYTVNGVRLAYREFGPFAPNDKVFVPRSADARIPEAYPDVIRERLISNGTYRSDGTVNTETARRLGWDKEWEERGKPVAWPPSD
jgi:hypothetical protein